MSNFIKINERAYKFIRGSAINSILDIFVELITNCDDAYDKGKIKNKIIDIELDYNGIVIITDQATGLYGEEMDKCFLQVGNFTSVENNRGFFSRGAKDICALGDIKFESIKNNKYSVVILNSDAKGELIKNNETITQNNLGIINNGLKVTVNLIKDLNIPKPNYILQNFCRHISLRNILNKSKCSISFKNSPDYEFNFKIFDFKYNFPITETLLYISYNLPSYPNAKCFFTLSKSDKQLYDSNIFKFCDWGIIITSGKIIHDITVINDQFKFNPYIKSLCGIINCNYINTLLIDFDKNGPSKLNPFPVLDPSRISGLNLDHPFVKELLKIPQDRLDLVLQELEIDDENEYIFYNDELMDIINQLNITGDKFIESNDLSKFVENKNSKLIRGIESDRGKFIDIEKNFCKDLNKSTRVNYDIIENKKKPQPYIDPMTNFFNIIGTGDEGNRPTDELDTAKLFKEFDNKINSNELKEQKQIYTYNKVDDQNNVLDEKFESQNYGHLKKDNLFVIRFIKTSKDKKYDIYQSGQRIILKININFPILLKYFGENDFKKDFETSKIEASLYLHEIISEALTRIQMMSYINRDFIKINYDSSSTNFSELFRNYDNYKNNIDLSVDKVIQNVIKNERNRIQKKINNEEIIEIKDDNYEELNINYDEIDHDKINEYEKENIKLKKENDRLVKDMNSMKNDFNELKELLMLNVESIVDRKFKQIEKFINFKFLHFEDAYDFINFNKIQCYNTSLALNKNLDYYNIKKYDPNEDINKSVLFYGVYRNYDVDLIKNHKGNIFIYWDDNDANVNYENRRNNLINISKLAKVNICGTNIVEKYFQIVNIKYRKIKF